MHLLNFVLQRHNDIIFVTNKREAKVDKKHLSGFVSRFDNLVLRCQRFLAVCVHVLMLFRQEIFTMRWNFDFLFFYLLLLHLIIFSSDTYAPKLNNRNTLSTLFSICKQKFRVKQLTNYMVSQCTNLETLYGYVRELTAQLSNSYECTFNKKTPKQCQRSRLTSLWCLYRQL